MSKFKDWWTKTGASALNERLININYQDLDYMVLDNLLRDDELDEIGQSGLSELAETLVSDGARVTIVTYSDGSEEYRFFFS